MQQERNYTKSGPMAFQPLPLGTIKPRGWLKSQIYIQAEGLHGHLDEFWPDVAHSRWIGGDAEGWERGPYWLDGMVPLAYLLDDERLKSKVRRWVTYILTHQHNDGWLGAVVDNHVGSGQTVLDPWPIFVLLKALSQYHEATGDERVIIAMLRVLRRIASLLDEYPLDSWAKMRWPDLVLSIHWLYERTGHAWLIELAHKAEKQGYSWQEHFTNFRFRGKQPKWTLESHVVNNAMGLKEPALNYLFGETPDVELAREDALRYIKTLDTYHGQATGVFSGDECLAGKSPSQGTELCAVVEYMFSLEVLLSAFGDVAFADRLERIAFNALPATFKSDMCAHQYDQQVNQVICRSAEENVYTNNGPDANRFGLEPNFGCCTANLGQGWPKLASHLWMLAPDGGPAALVYAPCLLTVEVGGEQVQIEVLTDYPFSDLVEFRVSVENPVRFSLYMRVQSWTHKAMLSIEGESGQALIPGKIHGVEREWTGTTALKLHLPMQARVTRRYNNAVTIERGPLIYSLKIEEEWAQVSGDLPYADWEVYPLSPWNYALQLDPEQPEVSIEFRHSSVGERPFSPNGAPVQAGVKGKRLPKWEIERNAAALPPASPVQSDQPLEELTLIPYGCTNLRVTEFPILA